MQVEKSPISHRQEFWEVTLALLLGCMSLNHIHLYQVTPLHFRYFPSSVFPSVPFLSRPRSQLLFTSPFMMPEINGSEYVYDLQFREKIVERWDFMEHRPGIHNCGE